MNLTCVHYLLQRYLQKEMMHQVHFRHFLVKQTKLHYIQDYIHCLSIKVCHQIYLVFLVEKNHKQHENPKKGRTWGPSSNYQKNKRAKFRTRLYSGETSTVQHHGRSSSFPNLGIAIARPDHLDSQTPNQLSMILTLVFLPSD